MADYARDIDIACGTVRIGTTPLPVGRVRLGDGMTGRAGDRPGAVRQRQPIERACSLIAMARLTHRKIGLCQGAMHNGIFEGSRTVYRMEVTQRIVKTARRAGGGIRANSKFRICSGSMTTGTNIDITDIGSRVCRLAGNFGKPGLAGMRCIYSAAVTRGIIETGYCGTIYKRCSVATFA
jgi:hypothetical protein